MGNLYFTIGTARSGKSTFCSAWASFQEMSPSTYKLLEEPITPRAIVCSDDIRLAMTGQRYNKETEPAVWMVNTYMTKALLTRGHDVIIDGTNTTEDSIWRILNIDHNAHYVLFDTPVDVCERRARETGQLDLIEYGVIRRHAGQIVQLKEQEGGIEGVVNRIRERVMYRWGLDDQ